MAGSAAGRAIGLAPSWSCSTSASGRVRSAAWASQGQMRNVSSGPAAAGPAPLIHVVRVKRWSAKCPLGQVDGTTSWKAPAGKKTMVSCSGSMVR